MREGQGTRVWRHASNGKVCAAGEVREVQKGHCDSTKASPVLVPSPLGAYCKIGEGLGTDRHRTAATLILGVPRISVIIDIRLISAGMRSDKAGAGTMRLRR
jgi:hypothetical protein